MAIKRPKRSAPDAGTEAILRHWREAVPNDRLAHLVKDATRGLLRAMQMRLSKHGVSFGHWTFLRILWETDGLTQRALSVEAGLMEPTTSSALAAMEALGYMRRERRRRGGHPPDAAGDDRESGARRAAGGQEAAAHAVDP